MLHSLALISLLAAPAASASPAAHPSVKAVFESQLAIRHFHDIAIAPDGSLAAWGVRAADPEGRELLGAISVAATEGGKPRRLTACRNAAPCKEWGAAFSPDGRTIAFLSDAAASGQLQIWVAPAAGGPPRQVTSVKGQLDHLVWSPDGRAIAFLFVEGSTQETGALTAYKPDAGVVQETFEEQRIAVADVKTGKVRLGLSRRSLRLRLRLVARRQDVRRRSREGVRDQQLLDRPALPRRRGDGADALDLEAAAADRLPALLAGRPLDRRHPRHHERRGLDRRRRLDRAGGRRRRAEPHARHELVGARSSSGSRTATSC